MEKIKIGQIGICHEHAQGKMDTLRRHLSDVYEIVGVVDDRSSHTARVPIGESHLKSYEGLKWMTEDELLSYPGLQGVMVETTNGDLVPTALRCMKRGLPMHMDKPGGEDMNLFRQLLAGCKERNLPLQMGYMFRVNPAMQWSRKAIRNGWLGDIFEIQASMSHDYGGEEYQKYIGSFKGGIMFNLGCHLIDAIIPMMGRPEKVTSFLKSAPGYDPAIKNNCVAILEYPHATVTLRACSKEVNGSPRRNLKICGTRGTLELCPQERFDGQSLEMRLTLAEGNEAYPAGTHTLGFGVVRDRYEEQLRELAQIIRGEIKNPYTYEHDELVQEVLLAASGYTPWKP